MPPHTPVVGGVILLLLSLLACCLCVRRHKKTIKSPPPPTLGLQGPPLSENGDYMEVELSGSQASWESNSFTTSGSLQLSAGESIYS